MVGNVSRRLRLRVLRETDLFQAIAKEINGGGDLDREADTQAAGHTGGAGVSDEDRLRER